MLNLFNDRLPYDVALESKTIAIRDKRLRDSNDFVARVVALNSTIVVGLGALALAGATTNKTLRHPHLLIAALSLLLFCIVLGTILLYLSAPVSTYTATYWAILQRRRELANLDSDYQKHRDAGDFGKHQNLEWHRELQEKLPAARESIVAAYSTVEQIERFYYAIEISVMLSNLAAYAVLVIFIARSIA